MALATVQNVRDTGGLPDSGKLADSKITPHLDAAAREIKRWIGDYSAVSGDDLADCIDAECCLTMAYFIPALNVLCPESLSTFQKEYGELGLNFADADEQTTIAGRWETRARNAVSNLKNEIPAQGVPAIGWNAV